LELCVQANQLKQYASRPDMLQQKKKKIMVAAGIEPVI
jgi:hypothetical protein